MTVNGDGGGNYNTKYSKDGTADTFINGGTSFMLDDISHAFDTYSVINLNNVANNYKQGVFQSCMESSQARAEGVLTWRNNPDRISRITVASTVNLGQYSYIRVFGAD